jgi:hypothetical protein
MRWPLVLLLASALGLAGCGSSTPRPPDFGGEDGQQIAVLVERMNDDGGRPTQLKQLLAAGTPAGKQEAKTYQQYQYNLKGKVSVSGDTATGTVVIEKTDGGDKVEKEWTFVKEGDKWKIKSAPLP